MNAKKSLVLMLGLLTFCSVNANAEKADEKHPDDPTKIVTRAGFGYVDGLSVTGSIGLDEARMINARINDGGDEWRLGGSWLFSSGILNFNFSRTNYDYGAYKNNYSLGTFIPLSVFGIAPFGIQIFPTAGYAYNDGEFLKEVKNDQDLSEYILVPNSAHSGYLGAFGMKPLTEELSVSGFAGGSFGSDDYSGHWYGVGAGYKYNGHNSVKLFAVKTEDDFGVVEKIGIIYTYELY